MSDRRKTISAIHILKTELKLSEDDYRALLQQLVGKQSCKDMTDAELQVVNTHMGKLSKRMGTAKPVPAAKRPHADKPQLRKLAAMWWALADIAVVTRPDSPHDCMKAVEAWAKRQAGGWKLGPIDSLRWASSEQLNKLIEELKAWGLRVGAKVEA